MKYEIKIVVEIVDIDVDALKGMVTEYIEDEVLERQDELISLEIKVVE